MRIVWLLLCSVSLSLWATDYSRCTQRIALSMERVGDSYGVALNETQLLHFSKQPPQGFQILKSDPFTGLYLLKARRKMVPLEFRELNDETLKSTLGVGDSTDFTIGEVTERMSGFLDYARFSSPTPPNSVITSICYQFYGLGTGNGFIESSYIKRFLEEDNFEYGALKALFVENGGRVFVDYVEPFMDGVTLEMGDEILSINGKAFVNFREFLQDIYVLTPNTEVNLQIIRQGESQMITTKVFKRTGGMLLPYHYLSTLGVRFGDDWVVEHVDSDVQHGFGRLSVGDRILKLNNMDMPSDFVEGAKMISAASKGPMRFLVVRDGFQFFVNVNQKKAQEWGRFLQ